MYSNNEFFEKSEERVGHAAEGAGCGGLSGSATGEAGRGATFASAHGGRMMTRRQFALLSAAALASASALLAGCSAGSGSQEDASEGDGSFENGTRTVVDMQGNEVEVPATITNCFDAYPVNVGIMALLGTTEAQPYILPRIKSANWEWLRELDPGLDDKETIGDDATASAEEVLTINPEVVVISNKDTAATYREAGINVFMVTSATTDDFLESVRKSGELFGDASLEEAQEFTDYYQSNIDLVAQRVSDIPEDERPTVYYVGGTTAYNTSVKGNGLEFVTNAGGRFALSEADLGEGKEVTAEQLLAADPDVIIVGTNNRAKGYDSLMSDTALASLSALQNDQVYKTPQGTLPWDTFGPEQSMAVLWMAKTLYPDRFDDIDLKQEMKDFYRTFYDYELSDEYADLMLQGAMGPEE